MNNNTQNRLRQIFVGLITVMLVAQVSVAPAAAASSDPVTGGECYLRGSAGFWGGFLGVDISQCQTPSEDAAETHAQQYASGLTAADIGTAGTTNYQNQLQASRNTCLCKVKAGVIESLQNGESLSTAKSEANTTIDEYYADIQRNVVTQQNTQINSVYFATSVVNGKEQTGSIYLDTGRNNGYNGYQADSDFGYVGTSTNRVKIRSANLTLVDNTTKEALGVSIEAQDANYIAETGLHQYPNPNNHGEGAVIYTEPGYSPDTGQVTIDSARSVQGYVEQPWINVWSETQAEHDYVTNNSMQYIEDTYANYNDGDFDSTDAQKLQSACSLNTLSSNKDTTGSLDWARASAVLAGYDTSANSSWFIEYTPANGETFSGARDLSATAQDVTVSQPTLGDGALITGEEQYSTTITPGGDVTVTNASLVLEDASGNAVTSAALTDSSGDGRYTAALPAANFSAVASGDTLTPVVEFDADDGTGVTTTQVVMAGDGSRMPPGWTYAPDGGESVYLSGALFTDWKPSSTNGSFDVNSTYDTANSGDESVVFLDSTQGGQAPGYYTLNGSFTVVDLFNAETGEPVNSTEMEDYNSQTFDSALTQDEITRILDDYYTNKYEDLWGGGDITIGGGGGGGGIGGVFSGLANALGVGGVIVLGSLLLILYGTRSQ